MRSDFLNRKLITALIMIAVGVAGRFFLVSYVGIPNLEIITALSLIAGIYLGGLYMIIVPLAIIFLSDLVIGNNYIFIFTWTAFMFIGLFGYLFRKLQITNYKLQITKNNFAKKIIGTIGLGVGSSIFFYLYTNFGWWLMSGMYEHTLTGLLRCYYMAIPFFRNNLMGNLIFVPAGIYATAKIIYLVKNKNYNFWQCGCHENKN